MTSTEKELKLKTEGRFQLPNNPCKRQDKHFTEERFLCVTNFSSIKNKKRATSNYFQSQIRQDSKSTQNLVQESRKTNFNFKKFSTHKIGTNTYRAPFWLGAPPKFNGFLVHPYGKNPEKGIMVVTA